MKLPDLCEHAGKQSMTPFIWIGALSLGLSSKASITHLPTSVIVSPIRPEPALTCPLCVQSWIHPIHWRKQETVGKHCVTEHWILEHAIHGKKSGLSQASSNFFGDRIDNTLFLWTEDYGPRSWPFKRKGTSFCSLSEMGGFFQILLSVFMWFLKTDFIEHLLWPVASYVRSNVLQNSTSMEIRI